MSHRLHALETVDNFRDYGDYATAAGRRLRAGKLFRSAHHGRASDEDLERIDALNLGVVVDLRRPGERRQHPSRRPAGFAARVVQSEMDDGKEAPHITFLRESDLTEESGRRFMSETYRAMPFDAAHVDLFSRYFRTLGDGEGAVLIHCAAGKDRTGLLAALTHHLMGVVHEDMIEDYMLTNTAVDLVARAPQVSRQLEAFTGRRAAPEAVVAFLGVDPTFIEAAWSSIRERSGSVDRYLNDVLGVDGGIRDRIEARLAA